MPKIHLSKVFWFTCLAVLVLSGLLAWLDQSGHFLQGLLGYSILLAVGAALIYVVWKAVRGSRNITAAALVAFSVRLVIGVALTLLLPVIGYQDSAEHQAGYIYADAYMRDNQAWNLAVSGAPISKAFSGNLPGDQYGGLLALSAIIYRFLSPDAHRPIMIIILGAVASACGVLCLWKAA
jgi:hypothetical protein